MLTPAPTPLSQPWQPGSWPQHVVLAGNPNVGKSVVFNALTGGHVDVSNFPGTTISIHQGQWSLPQHPQKALTLSDSPGVYGISGLSDEELVTQRCLNQAQVLVNVVSATQLARDLFLTQQLIDMAYPLVVAVNQLDELEARGATLDLDALASRLGVPVVGLVATQGKGLSQLAEALPHASQGHPTPDLAQGAGVLALEAHPTDRLRVYAARRQYLNSWLPKLVQAPPLGQQRPTTLGQRLAIALMHPFWGALGLVAVLLALYQLIGVWVAGDLVDLLESGLMMGVVEPWLQRGIALLTQGRDNLAFSLLAGEFGVVTVTLRYLVGVMAPLVFGFYLYLSVLEDCGYLPRLAVLADGLLSRIGLNGRAILPLVLGLGCVTMATLSTRVLTSQRERTIANALLAITIPCSAQLGVIMGMVALLGGLKAWLLYLAFLATTFGVLGSILNKLLPGKSSALVMDLPPLRWPKPLTILKKTWHRGVGFLIEAAPLFFLGAVLVAGLHALGWLQAMQTVLAPFIQAWLRLPPESAGAFVMGMVRRDFGLAGFYQLQDSLSAAQLMTAMVTMTLFVPCIASATVLWKERGWQEGGVVLTLSWVLAFAIGGVAAWVLNLWPWLL